MFLREGAANTREGRRTLFHELAHVLQQTGARPLGDRHPRAPRPGRRGAGLRLDASAEAAAEQAAQDALRRRRGAPLQVNSVESGIQPNLVDRLGMKFLQQLTDISAIEAEVQQIDESGATTGRRLIGRDVRAAVRNVASSLQGFFRSPTRIQVVRSVRDTFRTKLPAIGQHLQNQYNDIAAAIEDLAIRSSFEAERAREGRPARMQLNVAEFRRRLERYIFGKTGILLDIDIPVRGIGADAVMTNPRNPIHEMTLGFVFLPPIHGGTQLWRDALTHRTTAAGTADAISESERAELRPRIRVVLRSIGAEAVRSGLMALIACRTLCLKPSRRCVFRSKPLVLAERWRPLHSQPRAITSISTEQVLPVLPVTFVYTLAPMQTARATARSGAENANRTTSLNTCWSNTSTMVRARDSKPILIAWVSLCSRSIGMLIPAWT